LASKAQLIAVGETCSEFNPRDEQVDRTCEHCSHWNDQECILEIFKRQLANLDEPGGMGLRM
jgi:hypothetical protein